MENTYVAAGLAIRRGRGAKPSRVNSQDDPRAEITGYYRNPSQFYNHTNEYTTLCFYFFESREITEDHHWLGLGLVIGQALSRSLSKSLVDRQWMLSDWECGYEVFHLITIVIITH